MQARQQNQTRPSLYDQLEALPEGLTGEILNGQLYTQPRLSLEHGYTETSLAEELVGPFQKGRGGGPGGWLIVVEAELHFIRDTEVDVPDLAGWRRERLPKLPKAQHRALVVPDWVCEILSPATERPNNKPLMIDHDLSPYSRNSALRDQTSAHGTRPSAMRSLSCSTRYNPMWSTTW